MSGPIYTAGDGWAIDAVTGEARPLTERERAVFQRAQRQAMEPTLTTQAGYLHAMGEQSTIQWSRPQRPDTWSTTQAPTLLSYAHALAQQAADTHRSPYSVLARAGSSTYLVWRLLSLHLAGPARR